MPRSRTGKLRTGRWPGGSRSVERTTGLAWPAIFRAQRSLAAMYWSFMRPKSSARHRARQAHLRPGDARVDWEPFSWSRLRLAAAGELRCYWGQGVKPRGIVPAPPRGVAVGRALLRGTIGRKRN